MNIVLVLLVGFMLFFATVGMAKAEYGGISVGEKVLLPIPSIHLMPQGRKYLGKDYYEADQISRTISFLRNRVR